MHVGIIGLGLMGKAMAHRLLGAGYDVTGYDVRPEANAEASAIGVRTTRDAAAVAQRSPLLILSLMTSEDRRNLFWGTQNIAEVLREGSVVLDTTTACPEDIQVDHVRLASQGIRLVDVCVSGSSQTVYDGQALALVGDSSEGAADYAKVLKAFTKAQYYFDEPGQGNRVKLIVNTVFGLNRLVLAEALALARKGGFDLSIMLDILKQGDNYSVAMDTKGSKMISETYTPAVARLEQHAKDVGLIIQYAESIGADVPVSILHQKLLTRVQEQGGGSLDNAAIFKAYGDNSSVDSP